MNSDHILQLIKLISGDMASQTDLEKLVSKINREFTYQVRSDTNETVVHDKLIGFKERFFISCQIDKANYFTRIIDGILGPDWGSSKINFVKNKLTEYRILHFLLSLASQAFKPDFRICDKFYVDPDDIESPILLSEITEISESSITSESEIFTDSNSESEIPSQSPEMAEMIKEVKEETEEIQIVEPLRRFNARDPQVQIDYSCTMRQKVFNLIRLGYYSLNSTIYKKITSEIIVGINLIWALQGFEGIGVLMDDYELTHVSMSTLRYSFAEVLNCGNYVGGIRRFCVENQFGCSLGIVSRAVCTEILKIMQKFDCFIYKSEMFIRLIHAEEFSLMSLELTFLPWIELITMLNRIIGLMKSFVEDKICHSKQNIDLINFMEKIIEENYYSPPTTENIPIGSWELMKNEFEYKNLFISSIFNIWVSSVCIYFNMMDLSLFRKCSQIMDDFENFENVINLTNFEDLPDKIFKLDDFFPNFLQRNYQILPDICAITKISRMCCKKSKFSELLGDSLLKVIANFFHLEKNDLIMRTFEIINFDGHVPQCDDALQNTIKDYLKQCFNPHDDLLTENDSEWVFTEELQINLTIVVNDVASRLLRDKRMVYSQNLVNILKSQNNLNCHIDSITKNLLFYDSFSTDSLMQAIFTIVDDAEDSLHVNKNDFLFVILNNLTCYNCQGLIDDKNSFFVVDWLDHVKLSYSYSDLVAHFISKETFEFLCQIRKFVLTIMTAKKFVEHIQIRKIVKNDGFVRFCVLRCRLLSVISNFYRNFVLRIYLDLIPNFYKKYDSADNYEDLVDIWREFIVNIRSTLLWDEEQNRVILQLARLAEKLYWASCRPISVDTVSTLEDDFCYIDGNISASWKKALYDFGQSIY